MTEHTRRRGRPPKRELDVAAIQGYIDEGHSRAETIAKYRVAAVTLKRRGVEFRGQQKRIEAALKITDEIFADGGTLKDAVNKTGVAKSTLRTYGAQSPHPSGWPTVRSRRLKQGRGVNL
jgi:hypothetical protein